MKLIELSSDQPLFKTIKFNSKGLTLIIGDGSIVNRNKEVVMEWAKH